MIRYATLPVALFAASMTQAGVLTVCLDGDGSCPASGSEPDHYPTVKAAVEAAQSGDTVLIWPGDYVGEPQANILNSDVTVRGMDRYGVFLDGEHKKGKAIQAGRRGRRVLNVNIENMSATGYTAEPFYWEAVRGYAGRYLHTWGSGSGVYGIYSLSAEGEPGDPSVFENSYAYGYNDGGFYVGECAPCNVILRENWSEWNALGYSGTNAGGNLIIEDSVFNHNIMGILPNTLHSEDHAPQRGAVIRNNYVYSNNQKENFRGGGADIAVWGVGIGSAGGSANQIYGNWVYDNGRYGITNFWLFLPPHYNMVYDNKLWNNGGAAMKNPQDTVIDGADLAEGGGPSVYNCYQHNISCPDGDCETNPGQPTTTPPNLQTYAACHGAAQNFSSPGVPASVAAVGLALEAARAVSGEGGFGYKNTWADAAKRMTPSKFVDSDQNDGSHLARLKARSLMCMDDPCADLAGQDTNGFCEAKASARSSECAVELPIQ